MDQNLRDVLMPLAVIGSFTVGIVVFTRTLTDYILKKRMIDKGYVNDDAQAIFKRHSDENKYASLKWGLIVFFAGLSLILMEFIDFDRHSSLPYGLFAVSVSLGFLIYYFMIKKELNK
jgi:ABC-type maltose transport system permease subunit